MLENITNFDFSELNKFNKVFCLVSGGIDSTYLFEMCKQFVDLSKLYAVNCFNPLETNSTLKEIAKYPNFISVKPSIDVDYNLIIRNCFLKIDGVLEKKKDKKYKFFKSEFECCRIFKHSAFLSNPLFKEDNTVVIDGIKLHDGFQRNMWLKSLKDGKSRTKGTIISEFPTFYHKHKGNQLYCYPFRDFPFRELPGNIIDELKLIYPNLHHSGCYICPILFVFQKRIMNSSIKTNDTNTIMRINKSIEFYNKLKLDSSNPYMLR